MRCVVASADHLQQSAIYTYERPRQSVVAITSTRFAAGPCMTHRPPRRASAPASCVGDTRAKLWRKRAAGRRHHEHALSFSLQEWEGGKERACATCAAEWLRRQSDPCLCVMGWVGRFVCPFGDGHRHVFVWSMFYMSRVVSPEGLSGEGWAHAWRRGYISPGPCAFPWQRASSLPPD